MITLYHGLASTCSKKVRMCLYEKGIQFESHLLNLQKFEQHRPDYLALNPNGVVPTLVHDGRPIIESSVIVEYLDDAFPASPLRPFDPYWRAQVKLWLKFSDDVAYNAVYAATWMVLSSKAMSGLTNEQRQKVIARIPQSERRKRWESVSSGGFSEEELRSGVEKMMLCLDRCEQSLASGDFLVNGEFSLADVAMIPFIDRITKLRPEILGCGKYPKVMSWYDQMKSRPAFDLKMTPALRNCRTSDAGEMAKRRGHFCAGFRTPVLLSESRADAGGVRKAQRHEILTAPVSFNLWRNACKRSISRRNSRSTKAASRASSSQHSLVPNSVA